MDINRCARPAPKPLGAPLRNPLQYQARRPKRWAGGVKALLFTGGLAMLALHARPAKAADEVDRAVNEGHRAAKAGDYQSAARHYERARSLLPGRSAVLSYDLGTAYARAGRLGYAELHLRRSLQHEARPSSQVVEAARHNLGLVRQRAVVQAKTTGATLSAKERWTEVVAAFLGTRALGYVGIVMAWIAALAWIGVHHWPQLRQRLPRPAPWILSAVAGILVILHILAVGGSYDSEASIVVGAPAVLREGPGEYRPEVAKVQASSRVRVLEKGTGWLKVRLPGGLEGWIQRRHVESLAGPESAISVASLKSDKV